jgi:hypothetical protein
VLGVTWSRAVQAAPSGLPRRNVATVTGVPGLIVALPRCTE